MASVRVIPRRAERHFHAAARLQQPAHQSKDVVWAFEVFERIETDDDVRDCVRALPFFDDGAAVGEAAGAQAFVGAGEPRRIVLDADDLARPMVSEFDDFMRFSAPEVDDDLVLHVVPDARPEEHFELAAVLIRGGNTLDHPRRLTTRTDRLQELYCSRASDYSHVRGNSAIFVPLEERPQTAIDRPAPCTMTPRG